MANSFSLRSLLCFLILIVLATASLFWKVNGEASLMPFKFPLHFKISPIMETIFYEIRLPRLLISGLCGASLAGAGVLSQALFRNPLASPSVLGISSAGTFCACLVFFLNWSWWSWFIIPSAAFAGASINTVIVFFLGRRSKIFQIDRLLLAGLALSSMWGAFTSLLISVSLEDYQTLNSIMHWMLGGFSGLGWEHLKLCVLPLGVTLLFAFSLCPELNLLSLGSDYATSLSVSVPKLRWKVLLSVGMLVAIIVSLAGMLPFVGLLVPHLSRLIVGPEHKRLFIVSLINGASLTILAGLLARTVVAPIERDVGVFTALMGAPFFLVMLWQRQANQ